MLAVVRDGEFQYAHREGASRHIEVDCLVGLRGSLAGGFGARLLRILWA